EFADLEEYPRGLGQKPGIQWTLVAGEGEFLLENGGRLRADRELLLERQSAEGGADVSGRHLDLVQNQEGAARLGQGLQPSQERAASGDGQEHEDQEAHREIKRLEGVADSVRNNELRRAGVLVGHLLALLDGGELCFAL